VRVLDLAAERIRLEVDGEEQAVAPVVAGNVTVERLERTPDPSVRLERLSQLSPGEAGRVVGFLAACRGIQRRRMLDLGLVSGTVVQAELRSSTGDPTAYRIRGALIALRRDQASQVQIEKLGRRRTSNDGT
jgi:DtxR family Mn-dependent transcriptional regulator